MGTGESHLGARHPSKGTKIVKRIQKMRVPMDDSYYSELAQGYDELHGKEQQEKLDIILKEMTLEKKHTILDVGCGTGVATKTLPCRIVGIDPSLGLLCRAPFPVVCGVGESLPFKDLAFDAVLSLSALHHFSDPEKGIQEMLRVSKGIIAISVLNKSKNARRLEEMIKKHRNFRRVVPSKVDTIFFLQK